MSFSRREVEDVLRRFAVEAYPGIPWNFANQAGDVPARPFGTIKVVASNPIGQGDVVRIGSGEQITERLREVYEIDVSFQAFGDVAMDIMSALKTHARRPSVQFGKKNGLQLGFLSAGEVRDLAEVVSASWEGRAQCDFRFSARVDSDLAINTVGSVEIHGAGSIQTVEAS